MDGVATAGGFPGGEDLVALLAPRYVSLHCYPSSFKAGPVQWGISQYKYFVHFDLNEPLRNKIMRRRRFRDYAVNNFTLSLSHMENGGWFPT